MLFLSWSNFKEYVNKEFGFAREQEQAAFYTMRRAANETATGFVLRIEAKRKQLREPEARVLFSFMPWFDNDFR